MGKDVIDQVAQRSVRYWYVDGLNEISFGGLCLLLAAYFEAEVALPPGSLLKTLLEAGFVLVIIGGALLLSRLVRALKSRITYPRTGYVAYQQTPRRRRWGSSLIAMFMGILVSILFVTAPGSVAWMPAITGLLIAVVWFYLGYRVGLLRFYLLAAISSLTGVVLSISGIGNTSGLSAYYGLMGLFLLLSGGITLLRYLHSTRDQPVEA